MNLSQFHFAEPGWLWALLAIPAIALITVLFAARKSATGLLERFADRHILPHILNRAGDRGRSAGWPLLLWSLAWLCAVIAMAGPRWNYTETPVFKKTQSIVIVLDLSQSMSAADVKPSRVARALQEISDIMAASPGTSIGLVAYAAVPHMVTPLTDDVRTLQALLPALDTSLVTVEGDSLEPALQMASRLLQAEPGNSKAIIVLSDGEFTETNEAQLADAAGGNPIYAIGIGTNAGTPIVGPDGQFQTDSLGKVIVTRLQAQRLQMLAAAGRGVYVEADYGNGDTAAVLARIGVENTQAAEGLVLRIWSERFYLPAAILMAILLPLFRRGVVIFAVLVFSLGIAGSSEARAASLVDVFRNQQQRARAAFEQRDYEAALAGFNTPYRRGVAAYRARNYEEAARQFRAAADDGNIDALYNLGNAQLMMRLPAYAIDSYEAVLQKRPHDARAEQNLAIARKMLQFNDLPPMPPENPDNQNQDNQSQNGQDPNGQNPNGQNPDGQNPNGQNNQNSQNNQSQDNQNQNSQNQENQNQNGQNQNGQNQNGQNQNNQNQNAGGSEQAKQNPPPQPQSPQQQPQQPQERAGSGQQPQSPQQQAQQPPPQRADSGQQPQQPQSAARGSAQPAAPGRGGDTPADDAANAWLGQIRNDPASLLRNQFRIEDAAATQQPAAAP